jgi:hypothetical protein
MEDKPACKTCAYSGEGYRLECRIKPPSPDYKNYGRMFPFVNPDDWCSKYRVKPKLEPELEPEPEPELELESEPSKNTTSIGRLAGFDEWMEED